VFFRQLLNDETACASYVFGCKTHGKLAVVDPHVDLVDNYVALAESQGAPEPEAEPSERAEGEDAGAGEPQAEAAEQPAEGEAEEQAPAPAEPAAEQPAEGEAAGAQAAQEAPQGEEQEESAPRAKPSVPGAHLEVDIVPEGVDPLGQDVDYEDRYAVEDELPDAAGEEVEEQLEEPLTEPIASAAIDLAAGARYRASSWLLAARCEDGSPRLSLMARWTCCFPGRESTVMTYSLRRKMSRTGLVLPWYSRSRTASASAVSSSRLIRSPPQASHVPPEDGLLSSRL